MKKDFTSEELAKACLNRINKTQKQINAFITITEKEALKSAKEVDQKIKKGGTIDLLAGIPCSIKDIIVTEGIESTGAANLLKGYIPPYDATVIKKLKEKGFVILGKANCDMFGHGGSNENSFFGPVHNPWDLDRIPGGSSGGSAASVVSDQAIYSLGSDTGGSLRHPAMFCSCVGLKPTYGRVSRYGLMSFASSTDVIGPIAKCVEDAAILLENIAGKDESDSTAVPVPVDNYSELIKKDIKGLKIGVPKEYFVKGMQKEVEQAVRSAIKKLEELGAKIIEISLPHTEYAVAVYYIIAPCETSSNLARLDGIRYGNSIIKNKKAQVKDLYEVYSKTRGQGFGSETKRRIMVGTYALSAGYYDAYYKKAQKVRTLLKQDFDKAFKKVDVIAAPTSPTVAYKIGAKTSDPLQMYLEDIFLSAVSLAGQPALVLPCGFAKPVDGENELGIGLQLIGKHFDEKTILQVGYQYEQATEWHLRKPVL